MPDLPESLKRYLPAPILIVLTFGWWLFADPIKQWVHQEITHTPVQVRVERGADHLYVIRVEATRYSDKAFEGVQLDIQLQSKPDDIIGELSALNGSHAGLAISPKNPEGSAFLVEHTRAMPAAPISLQQRESLEIDLHESAPNAVKEVWFYAKDRPPISSSDLDQHWPLANIAWRLGQAILAISALGFLYQPLVRLFSRKALQQLNEDIEFLHSCWQADRAALARFDHAFQPVIDAGTAKYLKIFDPAVRDSVRQPLIAQQVFRRARSLPKLRRSLKGEVKRFVIRFCIKMFEHELEEIKKKAMADEARIR